MIEDFLDDPRAELRWFGWAALLLLGLIFAANLGYFTYDAIQQPDLLRNNPAIVGGAIFGYARQYTASALGNPLFGMLGLIGLLIARNFLSAFRHHRPHLMAAVGITPLYYVGLAEIGVPALEVFVLTFTAIVWTLLLPIPHSDERMPQATRGLAVGLVCAVAFQLGGVLVAAAYAGWTLYNRRFIEAAATGIAGALPPLVYVSGALALDGTDTNAVLYGLMLSVVLIEGFIGLLIDSFAPEQAPEGEPDEQASNEPSFDETETPPSTKRTRRWR